MEARTLMLATSTTSVARQRQPIIVPSQDIVLGSTTRPAIASTAKGEGLVFRRCRRSDACPGCARKSICTRAYFGAHPEYEGRMATMAERKITRYQTTRVVRCCRDPAEGLPFSVLDKPLKKKEISKLINDPSAVAA